ncbi:MAG: chemotaxis response regulator protein-glutamate methylesterase [Bacteroidota bacterium]
MENKKIKVLIIDDSALVRKTMEEILQSDPEIEVIGKASDPFIAAKKIQEEIPDVITLDIEMPRMDGLTFLKKLMAQHPIPVVVISTLTAKGAETAIRALEYGALEVLEKPKLNTKELLKRSTEDYCRIIKTVSKAKLNRPRNTPALSDEKSDLTGIQQINRRSNTISHLTTTTDKVIALGASTGGTEAIKKFLMDMPLDCPGIVIVQHMPEMFTKQFAQRLDSLCKINVKEASDGDNVLRGQALIAPGSHHMMLKRSGARYYVEIKDGPLVNRHKPSVDVLFKSTSRYAGKNAIGIILTGMGADGAKGILEMKQAGAKTIAQNEETSVVFGMPKEAIATGAIDQILPLDKIGATTIKIC